MGKASSQCGLDYVLQSRMPSASPGAGEGAGIMFLLGLLAGEPGGELVR